MTHFLVDNEQFIDKEVPDKLHWPDTPGKIANLALRPNKFKMISNKPRESFEPLTYAIPSPISPTPQHERKS